MELLSVHRLTKSFRTGFIKKKIHKVLDSVSFELREGEALGLTGTSGAGKSTLIRCIMQLTPSDSGEIYLEGQRISSLSGYPLLQVRQKMQMLFQNPELALNPRMTIRESMEEVFLIHKIPLDPQKEILNMLENLQLRPDLLQRFPYQLSGGELQRVCLGRILFLRPRVLILDEPTAMLDMSVQAQIIHILRQMQQEYGITILFISHDLGLLRACCDRIGILNTGKLIELAETERIFRDPRNEYTRRMIGAYFYT